MRGILRNRVLIGSLVLAAAMLIVVALNSSRTETKVDIMEESKKSIESLQTQYQDELLDIDGIVAVSIGLCDDGSRCLKIGTSKPVEEIRQALPEALSRTDVVLEYFGEIQSQ